MLNVVQLHMSKEVGDFAVFWNRKVVIDIVFSNLCKKCEFELKYINVVFIVLFLVVLTQEINPYCSKFLPDISTSVFQNQKQEWFLRQKLTIFHTCVRKLGYTSIWQPKKRWWKLRSSCNRKPRRSPRAPCASSSQLLWIAGVISAGMCFDSANVNFDFFKNWIITTPQTWPLITKKNLTVHLAIHLGTKLLEKHVGLKDGKR